MKKKKNKTFIQCSKSYQFVFREKTSVKLKNGYFLAVRPDRDQTGKQRIARLTKVQKKIISPNMTLRNEVRRSIKEDVSGDDWTRNLNLDLRYFCH